VLLANVGSFSVLDAAWWTEQFVWTDEQPQDKLLRAKNLHQALAIAREKGWRVVGACSGPNSITSNQLPADRPTILVMVRLVWSSRDRSSKVLTLWLPFSTIGK
jgi:hypothetical protein